MDRESWRRTAGALKGLPRTRPRNAVRGDPEIVAVHLRSVLHDRPVSWACDRRNRPMQAWRRSLPSRSAVSRRLARAGPRRCLRRPLDRLAPAERQALVVRIDGKPLAAAKRSQDRRAAVGRGAGGFQKGCKPRAMYAKGNRRMGEPSPFIRQLLKSRRDVETKPANLTNFGGGLTRLPPWVRGRRMEPCVTAEILVRLARDKARGNPHAA